MDRTTRGRKAVMMEYEEKLVKELKTAESEAAERAYERHTRDMMTLRARQSATQALVSLAHTIGEEIMVQAGEKQTEEAGLPGLIAEIKGRWHKSFNRDHL
jgi:hypothetical protein